MSQQLLAESYSTNLTSTSFYILRYSDQGLCLSVTALRYVANKRNVEIA